MEFKGTKGKWRKSYNYDGDIVADENDRQPSKCVCFIVDTRKERSKYDALLIVKAPEILELLSQYVSISDELNVPDHLIETFSNLYANAFNTIQEATTI